MERTGQNQDVVPAQTAAPGGQDPAAESQRPLDKHHPVRRVSGRAPGVVRRWERGAWGCGQGLPLVGPEPPGPAFQSGLACLAHSAQRTGCPASPGLPSTARLFQPPQARPRSGGGGPIAALGLVACFFVWGAPLRLSFCPLEGQLAHVTSQLPHAHGLGVSLDVRNGVPTARPVTGDEVRVGGLDLHHARRIALQAWFSFFFLLASLQIFHR